MKSRSKPSIITGIDIGSTAIRIAVGQMSGETNRDIHILGAIEVTADGVYRGVITSIEDAVSSLSASIEQIERMIGLPVHTAWIGFGGMDILSQQSKGVIAVAKSDGEIADEDVDRAVEAARAVAPPLNYEMLHIVPRGYSVDGQTGIKDPVGMTGIRLEVDTSLIHGLTSHLNNMTKSVYRIGLDIDDIVLTMLATADVVTTQRQKELGVAVVLVGGSITNVVVYEEGDIVHVATIPVGSEHVTNDLAIGLRTSIDVAEKVKVSLGQCVSATIPKRSKIDLHTLGAPEKELVESHYIAEIIEARMTEILEKVQEQLHTLESGGLLPAGVVYSGGGAKIRGLTELSKEVLGLPASLGYPIDIKSSTEKVNDLSFSGAIGLIRWGANLQKSRRRSKSARSEVISKALAHLQNFFQSLIP